MIISKQNAKIKEIKSLSLKKYRDELGLFIVEGIKMVKEAEKNGLDIAYVVGTEKCLADFSRLKADKYEVTEEVFKVVSNEKTPQGILAVLKKPFSNLSKPTKSCILLDGVADPANVGAIIRTAVAAGYKEIYLTDDSADAYSPKAVRASMSGIFFIDVIRARREEVLSLIDLPMIIADMDGENIFSYKPNGDFCLVIGNEGNGVSSEIEQNALIKVSIPMNEKTESLNASVSAGILMYLLKNFQ